jgi:hypothetical protein
MAGVPLYVVHTSCEEAHEAIRRARQQGKRVWGEPLIQHLTLDDSAYAHPDWDYAAQRVMSPPFRDKRHQDSLWAGLQSGSLSVVATDHCAFTTKQKRFGVGDFTKIPNGTGGLEDRLPMLWTHGVVTGRLTPNEFVAVTSTNIAKILNLYPKKGAVLVGADADLVVLDPARSKTITAAGQQSAIDYNVFEGKTVSGLPRFTLTRGHVAVQEGEVRSREGHGATFWFHVPLLQAQTANPMPQLNEALSASEPLRILVVDDNAMNLMVARLQIQKCWPRADIVTLDSAAKALALLDEQAFDRRLVEEGRGFHSGSFLMVDRAYPHSFSSTRPSSKASW